MAAGRQKRGSVMEALPFLMDIRQYNNSQLQYLFEIAGDLLERHIPLCSREEDWTRVCMALSNYNDSSGLAGGVYMRFRMLSPGYDSRKVIDEFNCHYYNNNKNRYKLGIDTILYYYNKARLPDHPFEVPEELLQDGYPNRPSKSLCPPEAEANHHDWALRNFSRFVPGFEHFKPFPEQVIEQPASGNFTELAKKIYALREKGYSYTKICKELECSRSTVSYHLNAKSR